ncbi:hypothetical protein WS67_15665 [Burkholderia singularis]|uniref:Ribosomal natural product, two-chain TOMM family n=1 Tax=Burkholderia singularis TaxID=1503053 RepID=A0A103E251_9BURK|nr:MULTISPECIES: BMA_0021/BMA_0022 family TOMM bacteriocin [Burkholderia]AOK30611.1 hypothetical protein AQ611_15355 [Burkholderia sp. Bp7605]KVE26996.1 hypothetical protein WS67_15665 [Burkholderia singularis]SMG01782.1 FIG00453538: hypothetical protein [Burkholderia singularis]
MALDNAVPTQYSLLEFQEVYLRAIALSWRDPVFKAALLENPQDAIERYLNYRCPWIVDLKITEAGPECGWDAQAQRWNLPRNAITFGVPKRPELAEQAIALAAYNDSGPAYLFSCC